MTIILKKINAKVTILMEKMTDNIKVFNTNGFLSSIRTKSKFIFLQVSRGKKLVKNTLKFNTKISSDFI